MTSGRPSGRDPFAGARFGKDEHTAVGGSHQLNLLPERFHGNALADNYALGRQLFAKVAILLP